MRRKTEKIRSDELYRAVLMLQDEKECRDFFSDICSESELCAIEQRFAVAKMLVEGKTYLTIQDETNASTATISRVGRTLSEGTGVIGQVIEKMIGDDPDDGAEEA